MGNSKLSRLRAPPGRVARDLHLQSSRLVTEQKKSAVRAGDLEGGLDNRLEDRIDAFRDLHRAGNVQDGCQTAERTCAAGSLREV